MKGEIEKTWKNETSDGRRYEVLQIKGERYSLWEEEYLDRLCEGQTVEFDYRESGDFRNITRIYEPGEGEKETGNEDQRMKKIIKMSCLRSASRVLSGSKIPCEKRAGKAIEIARKFEKYISDDEFEDLKEE